MDALLDAAKALLFEIVKVLGLPAILFGVWKRWIRVRVSTHLGCVYERPSAAPDVPRGIFVGPVVSSVVASAMGPEQVPRDTPYRDALFIRLINLSERDIT